MGTRLTTITLALAALLGLLWVAPASAAEVETLRPVEVTDSTLTFDVTDVEPASIVGVRAHMRARRHVIHQKLARLQGRPIARHRARRRIRHRLHRRVQVGRVQTAAAAGETLTLKKPDIARTGKLSVRRGSKTAAPETTITSGPSGTIASSAASFEFSSSLVGASFECRLDGATWEACSSPKAYGSLADGSHGFYVRARDAAGNTDASPASRSFTVQTQATSSVFSVGNWPDNGWNIFGNASPWNTPIDHASTPVDPNSSTMIHKLVADGEPSGPSMTSIRNWGTPIYFGRSSDPTYRLSFTDRYDYVTEINGLSIHVPQGARPSGASDGVMWVVDQTDGFAYMIQQAVVDDSAHTISARRGYRLGADGLGFRYPTGPPTGVEAIRPEELAAGYVNHAMSMGVRCLSGHPVAPFDQSKTIGKVCSGDVNPSSTRLSMGSVVFLDMSHAQIDALSVPKWQKAILKGLADYGAVVGLNGDNAWSLKFENPVDRTSLGKPDPYAAAGLPSTLDFSNALDSVGGWEAHLKVRAPFARPCSGICS